MKKISKKELAEILKGRLDFVLELYVLTEDKLCAKPVYKFSGAFVCDTDIPEFCLIYTEANDPDEIFASVSSEKFKDVLNKYKLCACTFHCNCGQEGEPCESFYHPGIIRKNPDNCRLLGRGDKNLCGVYDNKDGYFSVIFHDFIEKKIYNDCGIIAAYDKYNAFTGYLAYYEIAENIRDVSYICVGEEYRGRGYGKTLLNFFINKNTKEKKVSYYSAAKNDISKNLALSLGFAPCAKRTEVTINND